MQLKEEPSKYLLTYMRSLHSILGSFIVCFRLTNEIKIEFFQYKLKLIIG